MITTAPKSRVLGRMLVEAGVVDETLLRAALDAQRETRERVGEALVRLGVAPEPVYRALAQQLRLPFMDAPLRPAADAVAVLDHALARRHRAIPLRLDGRRLSVAIADPLDLPALDDLQFQTGRRVEPAVAVPEEIDSALGRAYGGGRVRDELGRLDAAREVAAAARRPSAAGQVRERGAKPGEGEAEEVVALRRASEAAPIVTLVDALLERAAGLGASDLHLEPADRALHCRARVDGYLQEMQVLPKRVAGAVVSRIKVMAGLDIATRRRPQDGRAAMKAADRVVGMRVSTLPTVRGEKVVIRLLDPANAERSLDSLGLAAPVRARLDHLLLRRQGALLVTGPTGSGKTTTLYAILAALDRERLNVVTLEDPVEYRIGGLSQVQVHPRAGLTFPSALRAVLRQDPDVVMVGEMRDRETVEVGMAAALTGHLVLSTLHTIDAASAAARLLEMDAPPYLVAGGLLGVLAQRIVRRSCPACGGPGRAGTPECVRCGGSGYRGRIGVFELMPLDDRIAELILRRAGAAEIRAAALAGGMVPLETDARAKVESGMTTAEEVAPLLALTEA